MSALSTIRRQTADGIEVTIALEVDAGTDSPVQVRRRIVVVTEARALGSSTWEAVTGYEDALPPAAELIAQLAA